MGHSPVVFEQREHLGGMMRYGIPAYRFPRAELEREVDWIVSQGIELRMGTTVPNDVTLGELRRDFDAVYIAIGAHNEKTLGIEGENAEGVLSAVEMLRAIGDGFMHDFAGQRIVVVGGGNVAMDVARTSLRLGAASVTVVYRRRIEDMTAQREEIEGAIAEGCEIMELAAPLRVLEEDGCVAGLEIQPQVIGKFDRGRPKPVKADKPPQAIECDRVLMAVGQAVGASELGAEELPVEWGQVVTGPFGQVEGMDGVFCGGDCESGPATVIRAIAAGKADGHVLLDLNKEEDNYGQADVPIAIIPSTDEIVLLQMDGNMTREEFDHAIELAVNACHEVHDLQVDALKRRYSKPAQEGSE